MGNYFKLKEIVKDRKDSFAALAKDFNMLPTTFRGRLENDTLGAEVCKSIVERYEMSLIETLEVFSTKSTTAEFERQDPFKAMLYKHGLNIKQLAEKIQMPLVRLYLKRERKAFRMKDIAAIADVCDLTPDEIVKAFELKKGY